MKTTQENIFFLIIALAIIATAKSVEKRSPRSTDTCGISKKGVGLVVRGQNFKRGNFPWIVALIYTLMEPPSFFCGGTLISSKFVLSAAHCILEKDSRKPILARNVRALFGAHDLDDQFEIERLVLSPKKFIVHDDWNHLIKQYDADLSILEFEDGSIHFNDYIQPICLWDSENEPPVAHGIVTGWGKSEDPAKIHESIPKLINVSIQTNEYCLPGEEQLARLSSIRTFCAGLKNVSGVCFGDSGGGLMVKMDGRYFLKGMVSASVLKYEDGQCDISKNAVYTNVWKFKNWIKESTREWKVDCTFKITESTCCGRLYVCVVKENLDSEELFMGPGFYESVEGFEIKNNSEVKFLPKQIGENISNLKELAVVNCGLTVIRDFHFKHMKKLKMLRLNDNKITLIELEAFNDLGNVEELDLQKNMIETIHNSLFGSMNKLEKLYLNHNKIKFLHPKTFNIPGGKLSYLNLESNVCINEDYFAENWHLRENDIRTACRMPS